MLKITALPALADNYIWAISGDNDPRVAVVDPGEAAPVRSFLHESGGELGAILVTHHHPDHTAGIGELLEIAAVPVYGPAAERHPVKGLTEPLREGDTLTLDWLELQLRAIDVPGHTAGHIALYGDGMLFAGDTLFSAGCGKLFEGDAQQMRASLGKLRELPDTTRLYCGHEYTEKNLLFAGAVEPNNQAIAEHLAWVRQRRAGKQPSLPSDLATERAINPFLRWDDPDVAAAARAHAGRALVDEDAVFATLRQWKDDF